jgi:uncharacterized membrane protein
MTSKPRERQRFDFIDRFRGFIGVLMLLGHCSYYLNSIWINLDPFDPLLPNTAQFLLRYAGYLCAPGFLMMAGAMVWWSYNRRISKGTPDWTARWHLIQRGIFLIIAQMTWVNSSWGGFERFDPWHFGIIAAIGFSVIFLTLIIRFHWLVRLSAGLLLLTIHPFLLNITYNTDDVWMTFLMQTFIDSGDFNKYPVIPWFALSVLGSVMATGWLQIWNTDKKRISMGLVIGISALILAIAIRMMRGYGNVFPFSGFASFSFLLDQKYPPGLFMNLWFFGKVVLGVTLFIIMDRIAPRVFQVFSIPGRVPLFFYAVHLAILGVFVKRIDLFYRQGEVYVSLLGFVILLVIMLPLCKWFYGVKLRSRNYFIQMI